MLPSSTEVPLIGSWFNMRPEDPRTFIFKFFSLSNCLACERVLFFKSGTETDTLASSFSVYNFIIESFDKLVPFFGTCSDTIALLSPFVLTVNPAFSKRLIFF